MSFTRRHTIALPGTQLVATVSKEQLHRAGQDPTCRRPLYAAPYPMGDPALVARGPIFVPGNNRSLHATHGWVAGEPMDPLKKVLTVAGVARVGAGDFRTLDSYSKLLRPLVGRDF